MSYLCWESGGSLSHLLCVCFRCKRCSQSTFVEPEVSGVEIWDEYNVAKGRMHLNSTTRYNLPFYNVTIRLCSVIMYVFHLFLSLPSAHRALSSWCAGDAVCFADEIWARGWDRHTWSFNLGRCCEQINSVKIFMDKNICIKMKLFFCIIPTLLQVTKSVM